MEGYPPLLKLMEAVIGGSPPHPCTTLDYWMREFNIQGDAHQMKVGQQGIEVALGGLDSPLKARGRYKRYGS